MKIKKHYLFSLFAGFLLPLAFAPFKLYIFAIISPAIFAYLLTADNQTPKTAAKIGLCYGLGAFGLGTSWIYVSIHDYGHAAAPLAALFTLLFITTLAIFPAIQAYLLARFTPLNNTKNLLFAFPASWILLEYLRGWVLTGFPWLLLGFSQTNAPWRGFIPLIGIYGTGLMLLLVAASIAWWIKSGKKWHGLAASIIVSLLSIGCLSHFIPWHKPLVDENNTIKTLQVSLVQGNVPQNLKWSREFLNTTLKRYIQLTEPNLQKNNLVIWPEAAIPLALPYAQNFIDRLNTLTKAEQSALLVGLPIATDDEKTFYNSLLMLGGDNIERYDKRHMVPFGEYLPFSWLRGLITFFDLPMSYMTNGTSQQPLLSAHGFAIAPFICYEIAYSETVRKSFHDANLLVTVTNDAWFGKSIAAAQHLQIAQARSLQTARPQVFVANDGITAVINADGKITQTLPRFKTSVLNATITPTTGTPFWYFIPWWAWVLGLIALLFWRRLDS